MTVCVVVRVSDSMVFVADSATSLQMTDPNGQSYTSNVYMGGDKVFNLYRGLPIMAMTCGMGHIGKRTISALSKELRRHLMEGDAVWRVNPKSYTIEEIAKKAERFFYQERFLSQSPLPSNPHYFELWVGGYGSNDEDHDLYVLKIVNGSCNLSKIGSPGELGVYPSGQATPILRLITGIDPAAVNILQDAGLTIDQASQIVNVIQQHSNAPLATYAMPVINAIELGRYLAEVTRGFYRFMPGADIVGGDLDIAVVTRHEGFKWIERKHYYPRGLNIREIDHVAAAYHPTSGAIHTADNGGKDE
jgi:hypothetical protein